MFLFTRKPSSGSHSQYLAKITHLVKSGYVELVQDVISVMAAFTVSFIVEYPQLYRTVKLLRFFYLMQVTEPVNCVFSDLIHVPETGNSAVDNDARVDTYSFIINGHIYKQILECK